MKLARPGRSLAVVAATPILLANGGRLESGGSTASPWPRVPAESPVRTRVEVVEAMASRKLPIILAVLVSVSVGLTAARVGVTPAQAAAGDAWSWPGTSGP